MKRGFMQVYDAEDTIAPSRIVAHGATDGGAVQATSATDPIMGVSDTQVTRDAGQRVDVIKSGLAPVQLGGAVDPGDPVTSDVFGLGIKADPATAFNARIVGWAEQGGVKDDIIDVFVIPGQIQG